VAVHVVRDFKLTTAELLMTNHVSSRWQGESARWFREQCEGACAVESHSIGRTHHAVVSSRQLDEWWTIQAADLRKMCCG
jgi:hypothetical protein